MKRIHKTKAKNLLKKGQILNIGFVPCKANLNSVWISPCWVTVTSVEELEKRLAEYEYYNCSGQLGTYAHMYVKGE